jgi:hypothetical protein
LAWLLPGEAKLVCVAASFIRGRLKNRGVHPITDLESGIRLLRQNRADYRSVVELDYADGEWRLDPFARMKMNRRERSQGAFAFQRDRLKLVT